jgi:hypothetical protein
MKNPIIIATEARNNTEISVAFRASVAIIFLTVITACTSGTEVDIPDEIAALENLSVFPADTQPAHELSLTPVNVFGDTDEVLLSDWLSVHVDPRGRVYIGDNRETAIHLFNADGSYNRRIGGEGDGPGEYRSVGVMRSDDNFFYHYDNRNRRITRYNADTFEVDGDFTVSVPSDEDAAFPRSFRTFHLTDMENRMLAITGMGIRQDRPGADQSERRVDGFLMNSETGEFIGDKVFSFRAEEALIHYGDDGSMAVMSVPYKRSPVVGYQGSEIIHGWNDQFLFKYYDLSGEYQRAVYYPYENPPLDRNRVLSMYEDRTEPWRGMVRNDRMPETWPSFSTFMPDDEGRLWVLRRTEDPDQMEIHLLDTTGELLAVYPWPGNHRIQQMSNGYLYSLEENEDGLSELVQYKVEL